MGKYPTATQVKFMSDTVEKIHGLLYDVHPDLVSIYGLKVSENFYSMESNEEVQEFILITNDVLRVLNKFYQAMRRKEMGKDIDKDEVKHQLNELKESYEKALKYIELASYDDFLREALIQLSSK